MNFPTRIPTTAQLRAHEKLWIESCNANWGSVLMEQAGKGAFSLVMSILESQPGPVAVFCGSGNNGGDGLVVARYLCLAGMRVSVFLVEGSNAADKSESRVNKDIYENLGFKISIVQKTHPEEIAKTLLESALVVDALLGTGLDRPLVGIYFSLIEAINKSGKPVVSIDLPSGIHSDTGQIMGTAIKATATATFGYLKAGLLCHPGASLCGRLTLVDIGLPDLNFKGNDAPPHWLLTTAIRVAQLLPARPPNANKGDFGRLLVIAGSLGMSGASLMASRSALRTGAGLVVLATPQSLIPGLPAAEVIYHPLAETKDRSIHPAALDQLRDGLEKSSAVVLGPGLSLAEETVKFVQDLLAKRCISKPCIIDADALNAIALKPDVFPTHHAHFVLTPHPKELSRLIGLTTAEIQANRMEAAQKAAMRFGCTVVLKGAFSVVANPGGQAFINPTGNPGMATAGAGDVLSGIIGGLLSQGMEPFAAAVVGTYLHGTAGDLAAEHIGFAGIIAGDIENHIPEALAKLATGEFAGSNLEMQLTSKNGRI